MDEFKKNAFRKMEDESFDEYYDADWQCVS